MVLTRLIPSSYSVILVIRKMTFILFKCTFYLPKGYAEHVQYIGVHYFFLVYIWVGKRILTFNLSMEIRHFETLKM